jgi:hypothetical protein
MFPARRHGKRFGPRDFVEGFNGINASCENVLSQLALGQRPSHPAEKY